MALTLKSVNICLKKESNAGQIGTFIKTWGYLLETKRMFNAELDLTDI